MLDYEAFEASLNTMQDDDNHIFGNIILTAFSYIVTVPVNKIAAFGLEKKAPNGYKNDKIRYKHDNYARICSVSIFCRKVNGKGRKHRRELQDRIYTKML